MKYVDLCICNEEDASDVFGIHAASSDVVLGKLQRDGYVQVAEQIVEKFDVPCVAITLRGSISASDNEWSGLFYTGGKTYFAPNYKIHIVDRVGGGDSFGGALIYAIITGFDPQKAVNFAVAASCLKQTIEYDFNITSVSEIQALMDGDGSGRVRR